MIFHHLQQRTGDEFQNSLPLSVAFYIRVSRDGQTTDNQRLALEAVATARGWIVAAIYSRDRRPGMDNLLKDAAKARFSLVAARSVDRLGRSLVDLMGKRLSGTQISIASLAVDHCNLLRCRRERNMNLRGLRVDTFVAE
jgi:hypothetical protein